jgi:hypothetical protein
MVVSPTEVMAREAAKPCVVDGRPLRIGFTDWTLEWLQSERHGVPLALWRASMRPELMTVPELYIRFMCEACGKVIIRRERWGIGAYYIKCRRCHRLTLHLRRDNEFEAMLRTKAREKKHEG